MEKPTLKNEIKAEINGTATVTNNISEVKEYALKLKEYYSKLAFNDEQVKEAKDERASVNKVAKQVADYRKSIVAEFKKPIDEFETTAKETEKILKETSGLIDTQVKKYEDMEKENKRQECEKLFNDLIGDLKELVSFDKIFTDRWLNKTAKMAEVESDIKSVIAKVNTGLQAIKELNSEFETELINTFLTDYDLSKAIMKNTELTKQKEAMQKTETAKEETKKEIVKEMMTTPIEEMKDEPIKEYTLKISATYTKLVELRKFMDLNKIKYEKVD